MKKKNWEKGLANHYLIFGHVTLHVTESRRKFRATVGKQSEPLLHYACIFLQLVFTEKHSFPLANINQFSYFY